MKSLPLVSCIITTYKRSPEIVLRAAESVLSQTYSNIELIIVDDSPKEYKERDSVKMAVENLGNKALYIQHETNKGACAARNTGLNASSGNYIAFLDDDDQWMPNKISTMVPLFINPEIAMVYCGAEAIYIGEKKSKKIITEFHRGDIYSLLLMSNFIGSTSFPVIRKDCLASIGGFDETLPACQDYDVWLRLSRKYKVNYTEEVLVRYYVHPNEQISKDNNKIINGNMAIISKNESEYLTHRDAYNSRLLNISYGYAKNRDIKNYCKYLLKAIVMSPLSIRRNIYFMITGLENLLK